MIINYEFSFHNAFLFSLSKHFLDRFFNCLIDSAVRSCFGEILVNKIQY